MLVFATVSCEEDEGTQRIKMKTDRQVDNIQNVTASSVNKDGVHRLPKSKKCQQFKLGGTVGLVLDSLPTAVLVVDDGGQIIYVNAQACEVLHRPISEVLHASLEDVFVPLEGLTCAKLSDSLDPTSSKISVSLPNKQEIIIGYRLSAVTGLLDEEIGKLYSLVLRDITGMERLRVERNRLMRMAAVNASLPSLLHELKNPLAGINTLTEVLLEELVEKNCSDYIVADMHTILREIRRMKLSLDGIGAVGSELRTAKFHAIGHALRDAVSILKWQAAKSDLPFEIKIEDTPLLPFDPGVVQAIVFNLAMNAIHASARGDKISVKACMSDTGDVFEIVVKDTGKGMTQEELQSCTELFFTTKASGSGIGMALCETAISGAGGTLDISSELGLGTSVHVFLPIEAPTVPLSDQHQKPEDQSESSARRDI